MGPTPSSFLKNCGAQRQNSSYKLPFWILVHTTAIHHCAKEQPAWLDVVKVRAPYCTHRTCDFLTNFGPPCLLLDSHKKVTII